MRIHEPHGLALPLSHSVAPYYALDCLVHFLSLLFLLQTRQRFQFSKRLQSALVAVGYCVLLHCFIFRSVLSEAESLFRDQRKAQGG